MSRLERGRLYHCRELSEGQTGHFSISDMGMTLELFDYERFFHLERHQVVHVRLETSRSASLHNTVPAGMGRSHIGLQSSHPITTYNAKVHANTVVLGDAIWNADDPIRRTWFHIPKTKELVWHPPRIRRLARHSLTMRPIDTELFDVRSRDLRVRCWYGGTGSFELGLNDWWPIFEIEFDTPRRLDTYLADIHRLLRFFSAAAGFQLTPSEIGISRLTREEFLARLGQGCDSESHQVEYMWPEAEVQRSDLHARNSFVCAFNAGEISAMAACLGSWLGRSEEWEEASTLMMGSLGLHDEVSGDRLLMACRWLEKIPGAGAVRSLSDEDLAAITNAAMEEAERRRLKLSERIRGALRLLRSEANSERFARLVRSLQNRFRDAGFDAETINQLRRAQQLRGTIAHGLYDPSAGQSLELQRSFTAVEAVCYLLMIRDLPMTAKGRKRAISSRLVRDHRYTKMAS